MTTCIPPRPKTIGTVAFIFEGRIIEETPLYEGETLESQSLFDRARRSIKVLGMPATDPVHGCNARLPKFERSQPTFIPLGH